MAPVKSLPSMVKINDKVNKAILEGKAVVALESTIIAHGMPYPQNLQTAMEVEDLVRQEGAVPATIAILDGIIHIGLDASQLETLARSNGVWKVSLRDLPYVVAQRMHGATTVAATIRLASMAGISFFVTGGIGGVHREASESMDISADLTEMSKSNVAVISAGVKSILDIGLTLEVLETLGVPVITLGQKEFPSFYSTKSGFDSPLFLNTESEIAAVINAKWSLGMEGAILVANPVPAEFEFPFDVMEKHIHDALLSAKKDSIRGKAITPYILKEITRITGGKSLEANIALVKNNAVKGSRIAISYMQLKN